LRPKTRPREQLRKRAGRHVADFLAVYTVGDKQSIQSNVPGAADVGFEAVTHRERSADRALRMRVRGFQHQFVDRRMWLSIIDDVAAHFGIDFGERSSTIDKGAAPLDDDIGVGTKERQSASREAQQQLPIVLGRLGIDKKVSRKLALDYTTAPVEPNVMALFRFADKLSRHPADVEKSDVDELRKHGWNDEAILETALVVSLYACANRFSAGMGLVADF